MANTEHEIPLQHAIQSPQIDFLKPIDLSNLQDKVILITGGASGLGAACFQSWASHGATVIIGDINETAGVQLVAQTRKATNNPNLHFLPLDVTNWSSQVSFFRQSARLSPHGGIDCVSANAGIAGTDSMLFEEPPDYTTMPDDDQHASKPPSLQTVDINLTGVLYTTHLAISYLSRNPTSNPCSLSPRTSSPDPSRNRDRHLILISSIAGLQPLPTVSLYAASKHALVGLFRSLRATLPIRAGIRVNMLCPYFVATPILGVAGSVVMAGGGLADIDDVVDALTRMVCDKGIIGRGVVVGPKIGEQEATRVGLHIEGDGDGDDNNEGERHERKRALWDVYAHDFEQSDVFTRRVVGLTNLVANVRGWTGLVSDLVVALLTPIRRLWRVSAKKRQ